jgi:hypothetical protein
MSYLCYLCLIGSSSLPPVVSRRAHVLFTLFMLTTGGKDEPNKHK